MKWKKDASGSQAPQQPQGPDQQPEPLSPDMVAAPPPDEQPPPPPKNSGVFGSGMVHNLVVERPREPFNMYLDEDRDGKVDKKAASCAEEWHWGKPELDGEEKVVRGGAVILVNASRIYDPEQDVEERTPLEIRWEGEAPLPDGWKAELRVNPADNIRIYRARRANAEQLLGKDKGASLKLEEDPAIRGRLNDRERVTLWMEAVDYPISENKIHWLVTLELEYKLSTQTAKVCIAPWIMASDLDQTQKIYIIDFKNGVFNERDKIKSGIVLIDNTTVIENVGEKVGRGVLEKITRGLTIQNRYLRDAMRFGLQSAPGVQGEDRAICVVLRGNNSKTQYRVPGNAINRKDDNVGYIVKGGAPYETDLQTGGNMMVSPAIKGYPWGRIICGSIAKGELKEWKTFFNGQCIQKPIEIDTNWLSVGHSDEIVAFVPVVSGARAPAGKNFRMLIASPRLAYKMLYDTRINWNSVRDVLVQHFSVDRAYQTKWGQQIVSEMYAPFRKSDFNDEALVSKLLSENIIKEKSNPNYVTFCYVGMVTLSLFKRFLRSKNFNETEIGKIIPLWSQQLNNLNPVDFRKMMDRDDLSRGNDIGEYRIAFSRFDTDMKTSQKWLSDFFAHDELLSLNIVWPELVQKLHANGLMEISKEDDKRLNEEISKLEQELAPSEPEPEPEQELQPLPEGGPELDDSGGPPPPPPDAPVFDPEIEKKKRLKNEKEKEFKKNKEIQLAIDSLWEKGYGGLTPKQRDMLKSWIKKNIDKFEKEVDFNNIASPDKQKAARGLGHCYLAEFPESRDFTAAWFLFEAVKEDLALLEFMPDLLSKLVKKSQELWKSVFLNDGLELAKAKEKAKCHPASPTMMELNAKIGELLKIPPEEWGNIGRSYQKINMIVQAKLDVTREVIKDELKLQDSDIIEVPILYTNIDNAKTVVADMVNFLLLNQPADPPKPGDESPKPSTGCQCIVPKPCGPIIGGRDIFEEEMKTQLKNLGIKVEFIDEWYEYHIDDGEIHCGTNQMPEVVPKKWWEQEPAPWQ